MITTIGYYVLYNVLGENKKKKIIIIRMEMEKTLYLLRITENVTRGDHMYLTSREEISEDIK